MSHPYVAVTEPAEPFWDPDVAQRDECARECWDSASDALDWHSPAAMPTTVLRSGAYLRSIAYDCMLALARAHGWRALHRDIQRLAAKPVAHSVAVPAPERCVRAVAANSATAAAVAALSSLRLDVCEPLSPWKAHASAAASAASLASAAPGSATERQQADAPVCAASEPSASVRKAIRSAAALREEQPSPNLWQTVFGGNAARALESEHMAADLSHLPGALRHPPHKHWHQAEPEGPVAEGAWQTSLCSPQPSAATVDGLERGFEMPAQRTAACACAPAASPDTARPGLLRAPAWRLVACAEGHGDEAEPTQRTRPAPRTHPGLATIPEAGRGATRASPIEQLQIALEGAQRGEASVRELAKLQVRAQEYSASLTAASPSRPRSRVVGCQSAAESVMPQAREEGLVDANWPPEGQAHARESPAQHRGADAAGGGSSQRIDVQRTVAERLLRPAAVVQRVRKLRERAIGRSAGTVRNAELLVRCWSLPIRSHSTCVQCRVG